MIHPHPSQDWVFVFAQSARWYARGHQSLLFRRLERANDGTRQTAIRTAPYVLALPGALGGAIETEDGWRDHPATRAAEAFYGLPVGPA